MENKNKDISRFEMMEPMKYYDNPEPKTEGLKKKWNDIVNNSGSQYIASVKHDGDWAMFIHYKQGHNLIRSRSISKVTGKYGDYTEKLPHLVAEMDTWKDNTVVLAEICWDEPFTTANTVGTILRCLPAKAIERQKEKKLKAVIFDVLMIDGEDAAQLPYEERIGMAWRGTYFYPTELVYENFLEKADEIIAAGGEGLVIQRKDNPYMPGTRTAWKTLKLKKTLPHLDLKVIGTVEPQRLYEGDNPEAWQYKIDGIAVTKPYFNGWKNGIIVEYNGVKVAVASGLTDDDRAWLATDEAQHMIRRGGLIAEIKAMEENSQGSLRHPSLVRLRMDVDV